MAAFRHTIYLIAKDVVYHLWFILKRISAANEHEMHTTFQVLIDDSLSKVCSVQDLKQVINKRVLSLINDFEDGKWRHSKFQNYLWDNIAQTALSHRERLALAGKSQSELIEAAKNLRLTDKDDIGEGSEIAEIFLYGFMKDHYGALPVVPKIFYKQNAQDNAKGSDSVHIVLNGEDDFTLWFGEAKFYNSIADGRLDSVVKSVMTALQTSKLKKENSIVTNLSDIKELPIPAALRQSIMDALRPQESIDLLKSKINVPVMILHECEITAAHCEMSDTYRSELAAFHRERFSSYFKKQLAKSDSIFKYAEITFHLILFPVPKKADIVKSFVEDVAFYKAKGEA